MEKPKILSDEQIQAVKHYRDWTGGIVLAEDRPLCQAQLDADVLFYEPLIQQKDIAYQEMQHTAKVNAEALERSKALTQQARHERGLLATALLNVLRKAGVLNSDTEPNGAELIMFSEDFCEHNPIQQAKTEVAREFEGLFETIEGMYPELRQVYWRSKGWQSLKSKCGGQKK